MAEAKNQTQLLSPETKASTGESVSLVLLALLESNTRKDSSLRTGKETIRKSAI